MFRCFEKKQTTAAFCIAKAYACWNGARGNAGQIAKDTQFPCKERMKTTLNETHRLEQQGIAPHARWP